MHSTAFTSLQVCIEQQVGSGYSVLDNTPRSWDAVFELVNSTCVDDSAWQATHHRLQQCLISAIGEQLDDVLSILTQPDLSMVGLMGSCSRRSLCASVLLPACSICAMPLCQHM